MDEHNLYLLQQATEDDQITDEANYQPDPSQVPSFNHFDWMEGESQGESGAEAAFAAGFFAGNATSSDPAYLAPEATGSVYHSSQSTAAPERAKKKRPYRPVSPLRRRDMTVENLPGAFDDLTNHCSSASAMALGLLHEHAKPHEFQSAGALRSAYGTVCKEMSDKLIAQYDELGIPKDTLIECGIRAEVPSLSQEGKTIKSRVFVKIPSSYKGAPDIADEWLLTATQNSEGDWNVDKKAKFVRE